MYAVQEPLIALFAGLVGGLCRLLVNRKHVYVHLIIHQALLISFTAFAYVYLVYWFLNRDESFKINWFSQTLFYVVIAFLTVYFVLIECIVFIMV